MSNAKLTSSSFEAALGAIENARTEKACGAALVSAASMVQGAILGGQSLGELMSLFESCAMSYPGYVGAVVDRAIDAHELVDGSQLRLWLVPVAITSELAFSSSIPLKKSGMQKMRVESLLQGAMRLRNASAGEQRTAYGWVQVLPGLYAEEALKTTDVCELVKLPYRIRDVVRGSSRTLRFAPPTAQPAPGVQMFYLPVVSYAVAGCPMDEVAASIPMATALTQWIRDSLAQELVDVSEFQACATAHAFSQAFAVGARMHREVSVKDLLASVVHTSGVAPNGLVGLVALYQPQGLDEQFIGVTLTSRLMKTTVGLMNVRVDTEDGIEELGQVSQVLRESGVSRVVVTREPVATLVCQHCSYPQYLNLDPSQLTGAEDVGDNKSQLH